MQGRERIPQLVWQWVVEGDNLYSPYHLPPYHFIAVPSALTETKFQRKKLEIGLCEDSHEVHLANRNRRNSASYDGLSSLLQFVLQFTDSKVFRHFRHPWAVVLSLVQAQTL